MSPLVHRRFAGAELLANGTLPQPDKAMIKQEAMKPGEKVLCMAFWFLNHSPLSLRVSWFPAQTLISIGKFSPFSDSSTAASAGLALGLLPEPSQRATAQRRDFRRH